VGRAGIVKENTNLIQKGAQLVTRQGFRALLNILTNFSLFICKNWEVPGEALEGLHGLDGNGPRVRAVFALG
jgi:hypothetical protein